MPFDGCVLLLPRAMDTLQNAVRVPVPLCVMAASRCDYRWRKVSSSAMETTKYMYVGDRSACYNHCAADTGRIQKYDDLVASMRLKGAASVAVSHLK